MENIAGKIHVLADKNAQGQLIYKTLHPETESSKITDFNSAVSSIIDARFVSPVFTGTPSTPTATKGTNTEQIATTAFVQTAISDKQDANSALSSIAGLTTIANQTIYTTGSNSYATTALTATGRSIIGATDAAAARTAIGAISAGETVLAAENTENADKLGGSSAAEYAKLASPTFTGTPSAPTADTATNNTQIATTAFVHAVAEATNTDEKVKQDVSTSNGDYPVLLTPTVNAAANVAATNAVFGSGVKVNPSTSKVTATTFVGALSGTATNADKLGGTVADNYAKLDSPNFTGTPSAPTANAGTSNTQIATTAFVHTVAEAAASAANTHYTTKLIAGGSTATANTAASGTVYLRLFDDSNHRNNIQVKAGTGISVSSDSAGIITITNSSTNTDTNVTQNKSTTNATYPILLTPTADANANVGATNAIFGSGVKVNPSTSAVTATTFIGALSGTATNATQLGGTAASSYAKLDSPSFSGTPTAPTAASTSNDTTVATTAFVKTAATAANTHYTTKLIVGGSTATANTAVTSGNVYLRLFDDLNHRNNVQLKAGTGITVSSDSTGIVTITNSSTNTDTKVTQNKSTTNATYPILLTPTADANASVTATNAIFGSGVKVNPSTSAVTATTFIGALSGTASNASKLGNSDAADYAKLASPTFTGTPNAPTATAGTNTTQIATTEFVHTAISNLIGTAPEALDTLQEIVEFLGTTDGAEEALLTQIGNKQDAHAALSSIAGLTTSANKMIYTTAANTYTTTDLTATGISLVGASNAAAARTAIGAISAGGNISTAENANKLGGTSAANYALLASPSFSGTPTAPTATSTSNDTTIATTAFVKTAAAAANTHYTTKLIVGGSTATANAAVTSGNVYLRLFDDSTHRNNVQLKAGTGISVSSDSAGVITITNSDTNTDTKVTQNKSTTNATYPILLTPTADATANVSATNAIFGSGVKVNPSTSAVTATTFIGALSGTATNANQLGGTVAANYALLASPSFSGTPTAPTATSSTSNTQIATTAFVHTVAEAANTHYTTKLIVGGSTATANAAVTSGNIYLRLFDDSTHRNNVQLKAGTGISISSSSTGIITITNSDTNTDTKVTQNISTTSATYPILLTPTANATANVSATNAIFGSGVKVNPSTSAVTATTFIGALSGNASTATKFSASQAIDGVNFDGSAAITHYGTCSTAASTKAKVVSCTGFTLVTGARIIVKFTITNTATSPTLNVNSTGAKTIYYRGAAITAGYLAANCTYEFVYNGTQYELVGDINTDTDTHNNLVGYVSTPSTNSAYPVLFKNSTSTTTTAASARFSANITINPSTNTITATNFNGTASKATADASGNTITTTYAKLASIKSFTIPKTGWTNDTSETTDYKYYYNVSNTNITANDIIEVVIARASMSIASKAQLCPIVESFAGYFRIRSVSTPTTSISAEYHIFNGKTA